MSAGAAGHRIGAFARRVGVSPDLLRAWEQRYGLLDPDRSPRGYRLYGDDDAARVARMQQGIAAGLSASEAAKAALLPAGSPADGLIEAGRAQLLDAISRFDDSGVHAALDDGLAAFGLETFLRDLVLPALAEVGRRWQAGEAEVGQEHFASHLFRGRLLSLARLWGRGSGQLALLACAPGERHDIGLIAFGLLLRSYGWRILFLGADTPIDTLLRAAMTTDPVATVMAVFDADLLLSQQPALAKLTASTAVFVSGPGASAVASAHPELRLLEGDVVDAAAGLASARTP